MSHPLGILIDVWLIAVLIALLAAALAAVGAAVLVGAQVRRQTAAESRLAVDAAVQAAVDATTLRAAETLAVERDATVRTVLDVASDKLGDTAAAGSRELDLRSTQFSEQVTAVGVELTRIGELVNALQERSAEQHGTVVARLQTVAQASSSLEATTQHLREALANPKQRGQWGERMAEDVLRSAGFVEGVNYRRQKALGSGSIPDISFLLPRGMEVRMDVKFPVDNYLRVLEAESDEAAAKFTKAFLRDVRARMKEVSARDYIDARDTVDCVLLFIPNESVFSFLHEHDRTIIDEAQAQKIVLCSPSSLFAVLAVIRQAVDHFQLERTSDEILRCLGGVTDQWERFSEHLDKVSKQLRTLNNGFEDLTGKRRRMLEKQLDEIQRLRGDAGLGVTTDRAHELGEGEHLVAKRAAGDIRELPLGRDAG